MFILFFTCIQTPHRLTNPKGVPTSTPLQSTALLILSIQLGVGQYGLSHLVFMWKTKQSLPVFSMKERKEVEEDQSLISLLIVCFFILKLALVHGLFWLLIALDNHHDYLGPWARAPNMDWALFDLVLPLYILADDNHQHSMMDILT